MLGPDLQDCGLARVWALAIKRCRQSISTEGEEGMRDAVPTAPPLTCSNPWVGGEGTRSTLVLQQVSNPALPREPKEGWLLRLRPLSHRSLQAHHDSLATMSPKLSL